MTNTTNDLGFRVPPPLLSAGTNDNAYSRKRAQFEELPTVDAAAQDIINAVADEHREDHTLAWGSFYLNLMGQLAPVVNGKLSQDGMLELEERGFKQLATKLATQIPKEQRPHMGAWLATAPPELRVRDFNWMVAKLAKHENEVVLRTRNGQGPRSVFSVVSPTYTVVDANMVAEIMQQVLAEEGCRAEGSYNGYDLRMRALWMSDQAPRQDDTFKSGIELRTSDHGGGAITVSAVAFRAKCANMDLVTRKIVEQVRQIHRGVVDEIRRIIRDGISQVRDQTGRFFEAYSYACGDTVAHSEEQVQDIFRRLSARTLNVQGQQRKVEPVLALPGVRSDTMADLMFQAWKAEPGYSRADVHNAVTYAAHNSVKGDEPRAILEEQAGDILLSNFQLS